MLEIILSKIGVKTEDAAEAIAKYVMKLPPPGEYEKELIKHNPQLSLIQKVSLIRYMRKKK